MNETETNDSSVFNKTGAEEGLGEEGLEILIPLTMIYSAIFVTGVVGNISTCIVISRNKHMQTATNYYLFSLAMSDLLLLVSGLPQEVYVLWYKSFVFGDAACVLISFAAETCANATVLTITAFTVERYIAICHPFLSHAVTKLSRAVKFVIAIWLVALSLAVPQAIQFGVVEDVIHGNGTEIRHMYCAMTTKDSIMGHFFEISTFLFFVTPMTLITVLYNLIGYKLRRARLIKRPSLTSMVGREIRGQNHVIRMLIAVVVAFFICWAPFHAQRLLAVYMNSEEDGEPTSKSALILYRALTYISGILYFLSTCINPLLYNIMSNKFRQAFKVTFAQLCCRGSKVSMPVRSYSVLSRGNTQIIHHGRDESFNRRLRLVQNPSIHRNHNPSSESSVLESEDGDCKPGYQLNHYMGQLNNR